MKRKGSNVALIAAAVQGFCTLVFIYKSNLIQYVSEATTAAGARENGKNGSNVVLHPQQAVRNGRSYQRNLPVTVKKRIPENVCDQIITTDERLWIAFASSELLEISIESILNQEDIGYNQIRVVVFGEDNLDRLSDEISNYYQLSSDNTAFSVTFIQGRRIMSNRTTSTNITAANWNLFEYVRDQALPHEYVLHIDKKAVFVEKTALGYLYRTLHKNKPWLAWGGQNEIFGESNGNINNGSIPLATSSSQQPLLFRRPCVFLSHLLRELTIDDFQTREGAWLDHSTADSYFINKIIQLSGSDRMSHLNGTDMYKDTDGESTKIEVFAAQNETDFERNRLTTAPLHSQIYVVACVYQRQNTEEFLKRLLASEVSPMRMHIHICNNQKERQRDLERLAASLLVDTSSRQHNHSITIHEMEYNLGGFSRFVLSRRLMENYFVDYVIMVDDDQYARPRTIEHIYEARKPMAYNTWYGKNWNNGVTDYWKKRDRMSDLPSKRGAQRKDIVSWQYGGTGMSIIDASIFRMHQVFDLDYEFRFIEDVWLSFVVHQISGWSIGRLFLLFDSPPGSYTRSTGQYLSLKSKKNVLFAKVNYLRCHLKDNGSRANLTKDLNP